MADNRSRETAKPERPLLNSSSRAQAEGLWQYRRIWQSVFTLFAQVPVPYWGCQSLLYCRSCVHLVFIHFIFFNSFVIVNYVMTTILTREIKVNEVAMNMDVVLKRHCRDEVWDARNGKEESGEGVENGRSKANLEGEIVWRSVGYWNWRKNITNCLVSGMYVWVMEYAVAYRIQSEHHFQPMGGSWVVMHSAWYIISLKCLWNTQA